LSQFRWLFVIARNSSFVFKGKTADARQIARELGVRYLLEGSVRKAGNRLRITGQLVEASTGAHLWADRFDGNFDDVFDLQDKVTGSVVAAIGPKLEQAERSARPPTASMPTTITYAAWQVCITAVRNPRAKHCSCFPAQSNSTAILHPLTEWRRFVTTCASGTAG
jgi:hypothetical protein